MKVQILLLYIYIFIASCGNSKCPRYFNVPGHLHPALAEYKVGDTVTVTSTFHREVIGYTNEHEDLGFFDLGNVAFKPVTFIYAIDRDSSEEISVLSESFDFIENEVFDYAETIYSEGSALIGEYNFHNDTFNLSYRLITQKPGLYYHEFGSWVGISSQTFDGKCLGDIQVFVNLNVGLNSNIQLLSESPNWFYNTWIPQDPKVRFYNTGGYAFRVVP